MAFTQLSKRRFDGFFSYTPGEVVEGYLRDASVKGETDDGKERGFIAVEVTKPCGARNKGLDFVAAPGQVIAVSITNATRVLLGLTGIKVRMTFVGFGQSKSFNKPYHDWSIEIDDEDKG